MLKTCILSIVLLYTSFYNGYAQTGSLLQKVLEKYSKTNCFSCQCIYSVDSPMDLSYSCKMEVTRNSLDTTCGLYYYFLYKPQENIADFHIYNGDAYYMSYKEKVTKTDKKENPEAFLEKEFESELLGKSTMPPFPKRPVMFYWTLFSIENALKSDLKDTTLEFVVMTDTLIDKVKCFHIEFRKTGLVKDFYFDMQSLYPKFYRISSKSEFFNQIQSALFQNFDVSKSIPLTYYAEENLLPSNWEVNKYVRTEPADMTGKEAPEWTLPLLHSDTGLSINHLKGKVLLLEFTATWCVHCIEAAVMMKSLAEKFKNDKNIMLLSIFSSSADNEDRILKFAEKHEISNKILFNAIDVGDKYQVEGYPAFFIVDKSGKIIHQYPGFSDDYENILFKELSKLTRL
jgi:thiol-disulfide isomerase/thioredoxin